MIKIAVVGIISIILGILFKKGKEEYSLYISIAACILILILGIGKLEVILASSLCKDTGYSSIAEQIELVGKLTILAISMPILLALLETINSFLTVQ